MTGTIPPKPFLLLFLHETEVARGGRGLRKHTRHQTDTRSSNMIFECFLLDLYYSDLQNILLGRNLRSDLIWGVTRCWNSHCQQLLSEHVIIDYQASVHLFDCCED